MTTDMTPNHAADAQPADTKKDPPTLGCVPGNVTYLTASAYISVVNTRFFRFESPLLLALVVGAITIAFTGLLAVIMYVQTCDTVRSTVFLPYVDLQVSDDAVCGNVSAQGWLLSDWVSYSSAAFSRRAAKFYTSNLTEQWQLWPVAVSEGFELPVLYAKANKSDQVQFGDIPKDCLEIFDVVDFETGVYTNQIPTCFRSTPYVLPHVGPLQLTLPQNATNATTPAPADPSYYQFSFTDVLPTEELQKRCPTISSLDQSFVQGAATGQFAGYADRLLKLYATGPSGVRQVNSLIRAADSNLFAIWRKQPQDLRLGLLHVVNETRQAYAHTELQRSIPWRSSSKANSPTAPANQTCTWTMCAPKALVAINVCNVYSGVNSSLGGAFGARNGHAGPLVWGLFTDAIMHMQVPMPTCCQYTPDGTDYWCASPSATAIATALSNVLVPAGNDLSASGAQTSLTIQQPLYNRVMEFDARVRHVCSQSTADMLKDASEAEQMVHELHMTVIGITADLIARNSQFNTDYRTALTNVGLQCSDRQCQGALSLVGTALGYAGWIEICTSVIVLLVYFKLRPNERMTFEDLTAIATDAPEMPEMDERLAKSESFRASMRSFSRSATRLTRLRSAVGSITSRGSSSRGLKSAPSGELAKSSSSEWRWGAHSNSSADLVTAKSTESRSGLQSATSAELLPFRSSFKEARQAGKLTVEPVDEGAEENDVEVACDTAVPAAAASESSNTALIGSAALQSADASAAQPGMGSQGTERV